MSSAASSIHLGRLDSAPPHTPDKCVWEANCAALADAQPAVAAGLRSAIVPPDWRPVRALDGFPTYRLEAAGAAPAWLGGTAAPRTRARAVLADFEHTGKNPALPTLGTGAELLQILERLPPLGAAFVFEADWGLLAALLRLHDLAPAIRGGRCLFLPPGNEAGELAALCRRHPGLLSPGNIVLPDLVPAARLAQVRSICEDVGSAVELQRNERILALRAHPPTATSADPPRLALVSLQPRPVADAALRAVAAAARARGWPVVAHVVDGPRDVHPLAPCEALAAFNPTITVCVDHAVAHLPLRPGGLVAAWFLHSGAVPAALPPDDTEYLAASPPVATAVAAALTAAGVSADRVHDWWWALASPAESPAEPAAPSASVRSGPVLLVGDLPDADPQAYGVSQATHAQLWQQLRAAVEHAWETPRVGHPEQLLIQTERAAGLELRDAELRRRMLALLEHALIPAVVLESVARALARLDYPVQTIGTGWQRLAGQRLRPLAEGAWALPASGASPEPAAVILAGNAVTLGPLVPLAAGRGWPLLIHDPTGHGIDHDLGVMLHPGQHCELFADRAQLKRALEAVRAGATAVQRRTARARAHVCAAHTYDQRLDALATLARSRAARRSP